MMPQKPLRRPSSSAFDEQQPPVGLDVFGDMRRQQQLVMQQTQQAQAGMRPPAPTRQVAMTSPFAALNEINAPDGTIVTLGAQRYRKSAVGWTLDTGAPTVGRDADYRGNLAEARQTAGARPVLSPEEALKKRAAGGQALSLDERSSLTPTGGANVQDGEEIVGRDGRRYRKTAVGFIPAGQATDRHSGEFGVTG